jgi:hypothetical protein
VVSSCEYGIETSDSIKGSEFDQLSGCQLLKKDSAPYNLLVSCELGLRGIELEGICSLFEELFQKIAWGD